MSNSLDPDQARHFVGPDLGPNFAKVNQQMKLAGRVNIKSCLFSVMSPIKRKVVIVLFYADKYGPRISL